MRNTSDTEKLYGVVLERLRSLNVVSDSGSHFTWEPAERDGVLYQHICWGPVAIADTWHASEIPGVPGSIFPDASPARHGDRQYADLIVGVLTEYPKLLARVKELEALTERAAR